MIWGLANSSFEYLPETIVCTTSLCQQHDVVIKSIHHGASSSILVLCVCRSNLIGLVCFQCSTPCSSLILFISLRLSANLSHYGPKACAKAVKAPLWKESTCWARGTTELFLGNWLAAIGLLRSSHVRLVTPGWVRELFWYHSRHSQGTTTVCLTCKKVATNLVPLSCFNQFLASCRQYNLNTNLGHSCSSRWFYLD